MHKIFLLALAAIFIAGPASAQDQNRKIPNTGAGSTAVTKGIARPGERPAAPGRNIDPRGGVMIYNNNDSVPYRALVRPYERGEAPVLNNTVPLGTVTGSCPNAGSARAQNKCIRDAIRDQRRMND